MRARSLYVDATTVDVLAGSVVAADTRAADGAIVLRKGAHIGTGDSDALARLSGREIHVVELEPGESDEQPESAVSAIGYGGLLEGRAGRTRYPRHEGHDTTATRSR